MFQDLISGRGASLLFACPRASLCSTVGLCRETWGGCQGARSTLHHPGSRPKIFEFVCPLFQPHGSLPLLSSNLASLSLGGRSFLLNMLSSKTPDPKPQHLSVGFLGNTSLPGRVRVTLQRTCHVYVLCRLNSPNLQNL